MENNSGQKQSVLSKRKSNSREENRFKKVGVSPLPGLTSADTFGLVACLAILSNRTSPSQALDLDKKNNSVAKSYPGFSKTLCNAGKQHVCGNAIPIWSCIKCAFSIA